jgi:hypothetical protein
MPLDSYTVWQQYRKALNTFYGQSSCSPLRGHVACHLTSSNIYFHFGKDFNKCQARLEALKLQITRWGISSGVLPDPETGKQRVVSFDAHTTETAQKLLDFILADTRELENKSRKYCDQPGVTSEINSMVRIHWHVFSSRNNDWLLKATGPDRRTDPSLKIDNKQNIFSAYSRRGIAEKDDMGFAR